MSKRVTMAAVCALAGSLAIAGAAQAQSGTYSYDPCKREEVQRGTGGGLVGGGIGAVIGSNAAARNARTEGAIVGGLLGALIGSSIGKKSAACASTASLPPPPHSADPAASAAADDAHRDASAPPPRRLSEAPPPPAYYRRDDYADRAGPAEPWAYGRRGERYRLAEGRGVDVDGCTLAESPVYMPDGRVEHRFVRVCRDSAGRYAVVD